MLVWRGKEPSKLEIYRCSHTIVIVLKVLAQDEPTDLGTWDDGDWGCRHMW